MTCIHKDLDTCAHGSTTHGGQDLETTQCPAIEERVKKVWPVCTMGYDSAIRKDETLPLATAWMDLENIKLSELSQKKLRTI